MKPWRCDPYLWLHLAGLATVPLWIDLCLLGLAVGSPTLPGLELGFMVAFGSLPLIVMQLWRPFYIFSLPGLALRPTALYDDQRRLLTQFRRWRVRLGALLVPMPLVWALITLYPLAFLARDITPFGDWGRLGGVAIAALGFFMANLFLQVPVAVLQVLATPDRHMQSVVSYPADRVAADFSWLGLPMAKILPAIAPSTAAPQASLTVPLAPRHAEEFRSSELEAVAIALGAAPGDSDRSPHHSVPDLPEAIAQQPDRSGFSPRPHPELDDPDGGSLPRDQIPNDDSLSTLASQPVNLADPSRIPASSAARNG